MHDPGFIQWLLEAQTPSVRYLTLQRLLERPFWDAELRGDWEAMKTSGPIPAILDRQTRIGSWADEHSYYTPKYTSTHWSMLILAELATDGNDSRLRRGALFMLGDTWEALQERLERKQHGWTCLWANLLRYALCCNLADDPRLRFILEALVYDGAQADWRCEYNDERPCAWGAARTLWGLAALPGHLRKENVQAVIQNGLSFLLEEHNLLEANYPVPQGGKIHPLWFRLNFPLFYQADILFVLRVLAELNALDHPGAGPALEWLRQRRTHNGRWRGASPFRQRTWSALGDRAETDRWVSLHAAGVLQTAETTQAHPKRSSSPT
ncbi:MAG: hypothetical protein JXA78_13685 [Anaerolineales bacterium]|nr:hypothetical protein [Anaerolineales bacterium]